MKYVKIQMNVELVEVMARAWPVDWKFMIFLVFLGWDGYDWTNRMLMEKLQSVGKTPQQTEVYTKLSPIQIDLLNVELELDEDMTADEVCQQLLEDLKNKMLVINPED